MLEYLCLKNVGPAPVMEMELAPRLNLITGDNGLGKTLLLDTAWHELTRTWPFSWPGRGVVPTEPGAEILWRERRKDALIQGKSAYDYSDGTWWAATSDEHRQGSEAGALVLYVRVDGGFSVRDPYRVGHDVRVAFGHKVSGYSACFQFDPNNAWDGLDIERGEKKLHVCEGLIRDWLRWALDTKDPSFDRFARVVSALAPGEGLVPLRSWRRVFVDDTRDIPLLQTPAGEIPIVHAPASMKRILGLAYVLIWAWKEHLIAAQLQKREPCDSLILLWDEVDAHLHPQWQRRITPALLELGSILKPEVQLQSILTTHSPLVVASLEPRFDVEQDKLFHLDLVEGRPHLHEQPWAKQGDVVNWLVSETFGLQQGRSIEAERAIEAAEAWMRGDCAALPEGLRTQEEIHAELERVLAGHDPFWPRWVVWTERQGQNQ